jgi:AcrR family transcriptional regulator
VHGDETSDDRPAEAPAAVPPWLGDIDPAGGAASAILVAAAQLFSERSPSKVTLREIAERAGVNYGLIHHYYGTKDAIVSELIRRASEAGAASMAGTESIGDALRALVDVNSRGTHTRMLAWALLGDRDTAPRFTASPAVRHLTEVAARTPPGAAAPDVDPQVLAAVLVSALMGWQLFRPFVTAAAELGDRPAGELNAAVYDTVRRLAEAVLAHDG